MTDFLSKMTIGTAQFGLDYGVSNNNGMVPVEDVNNILSFGGSSGVSSLDTAISYGKSESVIGESAVGHWDVITKLPSLPEGCENIEEWVFGSVFESLKKLNISSLEGVLLHRPEQLLEKNGALLYQALCSLKEKGLVKKIGVSIYHPEQLENLFEDRTFDIVQAPFSILDRRLEKSGWMGELKKRDVEIHVRSIFLQGLLLMGKDNRPQKFNGWGEVWRQWEGFLSYKNVTALQACLQFVFAKEEVDKVIVGIDSFDQLKELVFELKNMPAEMPELPIDLACDDVNLLDPSRWSLR